MQLLLQHGFKMFLGITPVVTNWSPAGDEFSLLIENNPLIDFVELPEGHNRLNYSNILCGALRGALEMVAVLLLALYVWFLCASVWKLSFSTLTLLVGRQEVHLACKNVGCSYVCGDDWSFARLTAPVVTTTSLCVGSGVVRIDPLHFMAGCHTRRLNQVQFLFYILACVVVY